MRLGVGLTLLALAGCSAAAADHERLGDAAYREGRFAAALDEYQAAQKNGGRSRVWAKAGAAAVRARAWGAGIDAFSALAGEDPGRVAEAAAGLERIAQLAETEQGGEAAVARAVLALRALMPNRPLGRYSETTLAADPSVTETLGLLPAALAAAGSAREVDTLLLRYADAQRATVACEGAARSYQSLIRRTNDGRLRNQGRSGLVECALLLGQDALGGRNGAEAERWFETVLSNSQGTPSAWRAQLGLGDARLLSGDALGASVAFQAVASATAAPDSLRQGAVEKLNGLSAPAPTPPTDGAA
ncbi:MAG: hypothetical protein AB7L66_15535 [Gemmatimonadales bacterium]